MSFISRATAITADENVQQLYNDWATTYDQDMHDASQEYVAPALAAQAVARSTGTSQSVPAGAIILDAGCGTGLVGVRLAQLGAKVIDGIDLSQGMLDVARKTGVYRDLNTADLSKRLELDDNVYDVVTCVGTLTQGHVGPDVLQEFVRVAKRGGVIVATVRETVWSELGFDREVQRLVSGGQVELLSAGLEDYRKGAAAQAYMVCLRVS
jgi:predicted TPR repeat methyltransferase